MEYQKFIDAACSLPFIDNQETADAAIKAVLGHIASILDESQAHQLTDSLPDPLTYDRLHSHQVRRLDMPVDEFLGEIYDQLNLNGDQARQLAQKTFQVTQEAIGNDKMQQIASQLPEDWNALIQAA